MLAKTGPTLAHVGHDKRTRRGTNAHFRVIASILEILLGLQTSQV